MRFPRLFPEQLRSLCDARSVLVSPGLALRHGRSRPSTNLPPSPTRNSFLHCGEKRNDCVTAQLSKRDSSSLQDECFPPFDQPPIDPLKIGVARSHFGKLLLERSDGPGSIVRSAPLAKLSVDAALRANVSALSLM